MRRYLLSLTCIFSALNIAAQNCPRALGESNDRLPAPPVTPPSGMGSQGDNGNVEAGAAFRGINSANTASATSSSTSQSDNNATGVSSAPGADAMMTRDLLLV